MKEKIAKFVKIGVVQHFFKTLSAREMKKMINGGKRHFPFHKTNKNDKCSKDLMKPDENYYESFVT